MKLIERIITAALFIAWAVVNLTAIYVYLTS